MSWKRWLPDYEVPKKIDKLVNAGILKDKTSYRDVVPHFETVLYDGSRVVLWVDHPDPGARAEPGGPKYGIEIWRKDEMPLTVFSSNYLQEALKGLQEVLRQHGLGYV